MPEKLSNSTAVDKALQLYELLLFSRRSYNATQLTQILQCSKSTVSRLIQQLESRSNPPILKRDHKEGREWYYFEDAGRQVRLSCQAEELDSLEFCVQLAYPKLSPKQAEETTKLLDRLRVIFTPNEGNLIDDAVAPISKTWIDYTESQPVISKLIEAIHLRKICNITYQKGDGPKRTWDIAPARILSSSDALYLDGWSMIHKDGELPKRITVYIQRIKQVKILEQSHKFTLPKDEARRFGIMRGDPFFVKVRFIPEVADYVCERRYSDDQTIETFNDGSIELSFSATSQNEVVSWLLGYGASAELISPEPLRRRLMGELANLWRIYNHGGY